jgi:hypothetical protein
MWILLSTIFRPTDLEVGVYKIDFLTCIKTALPTNILIQSQLFKENFRRYSEFFPPLLEILERAVS